MCIYICIYMCVCVCMCVCIHMCLVTVSILRQGCRCWGTTLQCSPRRRAARWCRSTCAPLTKPSARSSATRCFGFRLQEIKITQDYYQKKEDYYTNRIKINKQIIKITSHVLPRLLHKVSMVSVDMRSSDEALGKELCNEVCFSAK